MATVVLLGTLDTKGAEYAFLRERVRAAGCEAIMVDCGVMGSSPLADIGADEVAAAAGEDRTALAAAGDRGPAVAAMTRGATAIAEPEDAQYVIDHTSGVAGFFGASSMERLPTGVAITENMKRFRRITRAAASAV